MCENLSKLVNIEIPRVLKRQIYLDNFEINSPNYFFCISVFIQLLDQLILHLNSRFSVIKILLNLFQFFTTKYKKF